MARTPSRFSQHRETNAAVSEPAPAPASNKRTVLGSGPNMDAMKSATGVAVRNCPSSACRLLGFSMAARFMKSGYQARTACLAPRPELLHFAAGSQTEGGSRAGADTQAVGSSLPVILPSLRNAPNTFCSHSSRSGSVVRFREGSGVANQLEQRQENAVQRVHPSHSQREGAKDHGNSNLPPCLNRLVKRIPLSTAHAPSTTEPVRFRKSA